MSTDQFGRVFALTIDDFTTRNLDIQFKVVRTPKKTPNTIELVVKNLNASHRNQLQNRKEVVLQLEAGYESNKGVIFLGDVRDISSIYEKTAWTTTISSGDGERASQFGRINKSFAAGTDIETVMKEAAASLPNIGSGNLNQLSKIAQLPNGSKQFVNGITLSGNAANELDRVMRTAGYEWSIQSGQLQVLEASKTLLTEAVVLTPDTGLIGSPTVSAKGILSYTALLNPKIIPGRQLYVKSRHVDGYFKARKCEYIGDTAGNDWYIQGEAKELKVL